MARRVAGDLEGGGGGGGSLPIVSPRVPMGHVAQKLGKGFGQFEGGVVPTMSVDLSGTDFASRIRSDTHFLASAEMSSPIADQPLCETDALPAGGYTVTAMVGGTVSNLQRLERVNEQGTVVELLVLRGGGTQSGSFVINVPWFVDEGDTFRMVADQSVVGFTDSGIVALRHW